MRRAAPIDPSAVTARLRALGGWRTSVDTRHVCDPDVCPLFTHASCRDAFLCRRSGAVHVCGVGACESVLLYSEASIVCAFSGIELAGGCPLLALDAWDGGECFAPDPDPDRIATTPATASAREGAAAAAAQTEAPVALGRKRPRSPDRTPPGLGGARPTRVRVVDVDVATFDARGRVRVPLNSTLAVRPARVVRTVRAPDEAIVRQHVTQQVTAILNFHTKGAQRTGGPQARRGRAKPPTKRNRMRSRLLVKTSTRAVPVAAPIDVDLLVGPIMDLWHTLATFIVSRAVTAEAFATACLYRMPTGLYIEGKGQVLPHVAALATILPKPRTAGALCAVTVRDMTRVQRLIMHMLLEQTLPSERRVTAE